MDIQEWIKAARAKKGWNQKQLGDVVGRTKANVGHWETGLHSPSIAQVEAISLATGLPLPPIGAKPEPSADPGTASETGASVVPLREAGTTPRQALILLGNLIAHLDATDRSYVSTILVKLAESPAEAETLGEKFERFLGGVGSDHADAPIRAER